MCIRFFPAVFLAVTIVACSRNDAAPPADHDGQQPVNAAATVPPLSPGATAAEEPFLTAECPPIDRAPDEELARQAAAVVPLKPGLTLATAWHRATEADDVECLTQIHEISGSSIGATARCSMSTGNEGGSRRTCRSDLRAAHAYYTGAGDEPDVLRGTTMFSLSAAAFAELKARGATRHRYVSVSEGAIIADLDGTLERKSTASLPTVVNDRVVQLPVVQATGRIRGTAMGKPVETRVTAAIVDDDRFPLVLDYALPDVGASGFSVRYTKISYPTDGQLEEQLANEKRIDVYGIYFDFNSDRIRDESAPVLNEIAETLRHNPQWKLSLEGHTDNVGGAAVNMELSQRRSAAVRTALVERYGIAGDRLSTRGLGATIPRDSNDTPEGRSKNRRVELVRQ